LSSNFEEKYIDVSRTFM